MGMFDWLTCEYPLDNPEHNKLRYQTKDTPSQYLMEYIIREDGTLWLHNADFDWTKDETDGLFGGYLEANNWRWEFQEDFTGEIVFYEYYGPKYEDAIEYSAYFKQGKLQQINKLRDTGGEKNTEGSTDQS